MPPSVAIADVDVSAPKTSPWGAAWALRWAWMSPGSTRARAAPASSSSSRSIALVSSTRPGEVASPARLVPVPRAVTGTPVARAAPIARRTSASERASTTPTGSRR